VRNIFVSVGISARKSIISLYRLQCPTPKEEHRNCEHVPTAKNGDAAICAFWFVIFITSRDRAWETGPIEGAQATPTCRPPRQDFALVGK
jgi:hypothetical protein